MVNSSNKKKKKKRLNFSRGIAHVHATANNTIIAISDLNGNVIAWSSAGAVGYKSSKKKTPFAAGVAAEEVAKAVTSLGLSSVKVNVNGVGRGKETAIRSLQSAGLNIEEINDVTKIPHNGCRPPKRPH